MDDHLNPYLILGVDYGTDGDVARAAWAQKVRAVKRATSAPFDVEEVNGALHEVEHPDEDPASSVRWFRVPANRATAPDAHEGDLFLPRPIAIARRTPSPSAGELRALDAVAFREVCEKLLGSASPIPNVDPYQYDPEE